VRTLVVLLALTLCSGCWVVDELDSGMGLMEQHTAKGKKKGAKAEPAAAPGKDGKAPESPSGPPGPQGPGILHELVVWTKKKLEGPPPPPDPQDVPVRCDVGKSVLFTTRGECEARGGTGRELPPES
jgi:hypothetical protein